jgi:single-stranded-DNA-specific exonuclease
MFCRPAILLSRDEMCGIGCGSARSIDGFDLLESLRHCDGLLDRYGGHAAAAGVSMRLDNLDEFERKINAYAAEVLTLEELVPRVVVDAELAPADVSRSLLDALTRLEPFGEGNPEPLFVSRGLNVVDWRRLGDGSHLRMRVAGNGGGPLSCIWFNYGDRDTDELGSSVDLCYSIRLNTYNGVESVQLVVAGLSPGQLQSGNG